MKIGLFFGSFNPIHVGHLIIANNIIDNTDLQQIWFVISPQNPFKKSSTLLNEYDRLSLVQLAIAENDSFRASDLEFSLPKPSYTCDTMAYIQSLYPQHQFSIIIGSDSYQNLPRWKNADYLINNFDFYVYERPNALVDKSTLQDNFKLINAPLLDISSTYIRDCIKKGKSTKYLMIDAVAKEIDRCLYYR